MRVIRLLLLLLLLATAAPAAQQPPAISLSLKPQVGYRPLNVAARIVIEPHYLNRGVCIVWESSIYSGAGCWQVEGQYAPRAHTYTIKNLQTPVDVTTVYTVRAELITVRDRIVTPTQLVQVLHHF